MVELFMNLCVSTTSQLAPPIKPQLKHEEEKGEERNGRAGLTSLNVFVLPFVREKCNETFRRKTKSFS